MIKFISQLSEETIISFANRLTGRTDKPKVEKELKHIAVYYTDYNGGHYDSITSVKFDDCSYTLDNRKSNVKESMLWVDYVYINLPKSLKNDYAKLWNTCSEKDLNQCKFIVAKKEDYILQTTQNIGDSDEDEEKEL
ncbi:MAG: hypothetical protein J6A28_05050 [Clostridia bacterium]|nr:hypothetical protein [Clostridia bacterium]